VRQLTNSAGAVTDTYDYDAFGNDINHAGSTPNNYLYRGEQYDPDLGLYYLRARYYNSTTGRFMSRDPQDNSLRTPNDLHKYLYANGDPVNGWDPTGRGDLVELDVQFTRFLKKAPTLAEWGIQMVDCILAMANEIQDLVEEPDVRISKDSAAEVGVTCGLFFFNSFRLIYAMAP
jgi:RHS repeat-associated protein